METQLVDYKLKQLFMLNKKNKLAAIKLLIDSIADDKVYDTKAERETEREYNELENKNKPMSREMELLNRIANGGDLTPEDTKYHEDNEAIMTAPNGYKK